jgi:hypothetical protein
LQSRVFPIFLSFLNNFKMIKLKNLRTFLHHAVLFSLDPDILAGRAGASAESTTFRHRRRLRPNRVFWMVLFDGWRRWWLATLLNLTDDVGDFCVIIAHEHFDDLEALVDGLQITVDGDISTKNKQFLSEFKDNKKPTVAGPPAA